MPKPLYVVIEGIDACGKSTVITGLVSELRSKYTSILLAKEPGRDRQWGAKIYEDLADKSPKALHRTDPEAFQSLYVWDRRDNLKIVSVALQVGVSCIQDRSFISTFCYGHASGLSFERILALHRKYIFPELLIPDLAIVVNIPAWMAVERMRISGRDQDGFEQKIAFLENVRKAYLEYFPPFIRHFCSTDFKYVIVDGGFRPEAVLSAVLAEINKLQ